MALTLLGIDPAPSAFAQAPAPPVTPGAPAPAAPEPSPQAPTPATAPPPIVGQSPEPGKVIGERKPTIGLMFQAPDAIDPKSVLLEVDGIDVTMLAKVEGGNVAYVPAQPLTHGEHKVKLTAAGKDGAAFAPVEWSFKIRRFSMFEDASLSGELSNTYEGAVRKPRKEPTDGSGISHKTETPVHNFQNNLSVRGLLKEGDFTAKLDANIRYVDDFKPQKRPKEDTEKLDIANYLIGLDKKPFTFELGDILVNEGFYGAPSLSRRGMHLVAKDDGLGLMAHLFGTRYETTQGHDPFFGPEEDHSVLWGGAVAYSPFADKEILRLHVMNVQGWRFSSAPGSNVGTIVSGEEGDLWSFGTSSSFANGRFKILTEIAFAEFDTNTTDEFQEQADKAWRVRVEGQEPLFMLMDAPVALRWGGEYSRVGFSFRSPANPGLQPDRDGVAIKTDTTWKIATLSMGYAAFHDNTDDLPTLPRMLTQIWNGGLALAPQDWPSVAFNYNRSEQVSINDPQALSTGIRNANNTSDTYTLSSGLAREVWSANITLSANLFNDKRSVPVGSNGGDRDTFTAQGSFSFKPLPNLSLTPSLTWTRIEEKTKQAIGPNGEQDLQKVRTETLTGTLGTTYEIIAQILTLDIQGSGTSTQTSDSLQDNQVYSGVARLTYNLGKLFWDYGKQAVSLRVNWNRTLDHVVPRDTNEIGVFMILDLLSPYNL